MNEDTSSVRLVQVRGEVEEEGLQQEVKVKKEK